MIGQPSVRTREFQRIRLLVGDFSETLVHGDAERRSPLCARFAIRRVIGERSLTDLAAATPIVPELASAYPRLRGGAALVSAPLFAAPRIA